jgi:hypothetical protein
MEGFSDRVKPNEMMTEEQRQKAVASAKTSGRKRAA